MVVIQECHLVELRIRMNVYDHRSFSALQMQQREKPEKSSPEREFEP